MSDLEDVIAASNAVLEELFHQMEKRDLAVHDVYLIVNVLVEIVEERMIPERNHE